MVELRIMTQKGKESMQRDIKIQKMSLQIEMRTEELNLSTHMVLLLTSGNPVILS